MGRQVAVKRLIGVVAQRPNLDFSLTAFEILAFHGAYFGLSAQERTQRAEALLDRFKLRDRAHQMVRGFSGGMMQRLSIARAMMHDPQVLFLDEPSAGLDPQTRLLLWEIIREYNHGGKTILLTTHNMEEADALCQRLAIIDHGSIIALGTPRELKASVPGGFSVASPLRPGFPRSAAAFPDLAGCQGSPCHRLTTAPISMPTEEVRWFQRSPISPPLPASSCVMCTSPSRVWKIFFCTTPEGVCVNES